MESRYWHTMPAELPFGELDDRQPRWKHAAMLHSALTLLQYAYPLFMLFFGIGELLKLVVLVKAVVVPVTIHTLVGVRDAQPKLREAAAVLRLPHACWSGG